MLSGGLFRGAAKEQVIYVLEEGARVEQASGQVLVQSLPEVGSMVHVSCVVSWVSGSVQVKAKRNWQSGWSGMVKKASLRSVTVK